MSLITYRLPIVTNSSGVASATVRAAGCRLVAVEVTLGSLSTPDIELTDEPSGRSLLAVAGLAADAFYQPAAQMADPADGTDLSGAFGVPTVTGRIEVAITGGGDTTTGEITVVIER